jgi:hypothetical protein
VLGETAVSAFALSAAPLNPRLSSRLYGLVASPVALDDTFRGAGKVDRADAEGGGRGAATEEGAGGADSPLVVEPDG